MKKFILSISVALLSMFYIVYQRQTQSDAQVLAPVINGGPGGQTGDNAAAPSPPPAVANNSAPPVAPAPAPTPAPQPKPAGQYKDGQYTGPSVDAYYGNVQVRAIISGGKISNVQFLDYPQDRGTSRQINGQAMPYLIQEAVAAQNANVDIISGATDTSMAFQQSLGAALARAKN